MSKFLYVNDSSLDRKVDIAAGAGRFEVYESEPHLFQERSDGYIGGFSLSTDSGWSEQIFDLKLWV